MTPQSQEPSNALIYTAILDLKGDIGELKASKTADHEFIVAVSSKADKVRGELNTHVETLGAHGVGLERKVLFKLGGGIAVFIGAIQGLIEILRWRHHGP